MPLQSWSNRSIVKSVQTRRRVKQQQRVRKKKQGSLSEIKEVWCHGRCIEQTRSPVRTHHCLCCCMQSHKKERKLKWDKRRIASREVQLTSCHKRRDDRKFHSLATKSKGPLQKRKGLRILEEGSNLTKHSPVKSSGLCRVWRDCKTEGGATATANERRKTARTVRVSVSVRNRWIIGTKEASIFPQYDQLAEFGQFNLNYNVCI